MVDEKLSLRMRYTMTKKKSDIPHFTAFLYAVFAGAWIYFSDRLLESLAPDLSTLNILQTYKGMFFVVVTTILLFLILRVRINKLRGVMESKSLTESALLEREEQFRLIYENSGDAILLTNPSGTIISANPAACRMFKRTEMEICDLGRNGIVDTGDPRLQTSLDEYRKTGRFDGVMNMKRSDGSIFPAHVSANNYLNSVGTKQTSLIIRDISKQVVSEEELLEEKKKYQYLFDRNPQPMWVYDITTLSFLAVNDAAQEKYGYTQDEFLRMTIKDIRPPEDIPRLMENVNGVIEGLNTSSPWRHIKKDGTMIDVEIIGHTMMFEGKHAEMILVNDITERKKYDEKLRESETRFRKIYEDGANGMVLAGKDFKFIMTNRTFCHMTGYQEEELKQLTFHQITHPDDRDKDLSSATKMMAGEIDVYRTEKRYSRKDGESFWAQVTVSPIYDSNGHFLYFVGIIVNVTEHKQAVMKLADSEERLRLSLQAANQGIYDLNTLTGETIVSPEYASMLGYDPATFVETNQAWIDRLHPDDKEGVASFYKQYIKGEIPEYRVEFRQLTKTGEWKWILSIGKVIERTPDGQPKRMLGTHTDITDKKNREQKIEKQLEELRRWHDAMLGREERISELKQEVNDLLAKLGEPSRYRSVEHEGDIRD